MAATTVNVLNPETGATGEIDINRLAEAVAHGARVAQPLTLFNPETGKSGLIDDPEKATEALKMGAIPAGSQAHTIATTGKLESFARGAAQGLTGGSADELSGAVESLLTPKTYRQARDESRANFAAAEQANPLSSLAGNIGGGAASFLVPGMGALSKGGAIATGAKLGALYGAGNSTADLTQGDVGGFLKDVGKEALFGGGTAGALSFARSQLAKTSETLGHVFNPGEQRLLALGAKPKDLLGPKSSRLTEAQEVLQKNGVFDRAPGEGLPSREAMADRIEALRQNTADELVNLFERHGEARISLKPLESTVDDLWKIVGSVPPSQEDGVYREAVDVLQRIQNSDGKLSELWKIKKDTGKWVNWDKTNRTMSGNTEVYKTVNRALGDLLENATDDIAAQSGSKRLAELNQAYAAASNTQDMLAKQIAQDRNPTRLFGQKAGDTLGGGLGAYAGSMLGGHFGAGIGAAVGYKVSAGLRSAEGRLLRAEVGEAIHQKAQQAAVAMGAVPRTVDGVKQWVQQNIQTLSQAAPQLAPMMARLSTEPPPAAETTIRAAMPILARFMAPSPYASELNGKVSEPADRLTIEKQLKQMPGMSPSSLAVRMSALNRDGTIPPEVFSPSTAQTIDQQMDDYAARLKAMGY